jgi:hypothetical protein
VNSSNPLACDVATGFSEKTRTLLKIAERPDTAANSNNVDPCSRTSMNDASRQRFLE